MAEATPDGNSVNRAHAREDAQETHDWIDSLDEVFARSGPERVRDLIEYLSLHAQKAGVHVPFTANTAYVNTIGLAEQPPYPGNLELEKRIRSLIRYNAMAMVVRANKREDGIGGHISTYASAATLYEVGFNHFFRAASDDHPGDLVYFQGHASPGVYARAFLEGRLDENNLANFRRELCDEGGLSSYPHPWLMPSFWQFPTVSMGIGPITAIYHARYIKYLEDRGLKARSDQKVWAFLGDGETDEPESLGAITLASREKLDNLIFVINCNLQRLDGPVRGNGKIIQELEAAFRGAGWNVIKVVWGSDWDPILAKDKEGKLLKRMLEVVDGQYQKYIVEGGDYIRKDFFGKDPELLRMVSNLSDDEINHLSRGGHDPLKVFAAFDAAMKHTGQPTVILSHTVKGYGLGKAAEGLNITHQQKKLDADSIRHFRRRFNVPIPEDEIVDLPFYRPDPDSPEIQYIKKQRKNLGGSVPQRRTEAPPLQAPGDEMIQEFLDGTGDRAVSTTMAFVRVLAKLMADPALGRFIVPMVPDEARTFGMDALFRQFGIYSHPGQLYEPVDKANLLYYKEATDGQILEEGITEAGCLSSFIAAGTAYANHGISTIPFFTFYSMFGMQRVGDFVWAAADSRTRGFLMGATAGRTTLAGEGLQHQDGNSHLIAMTVPNLMQYDPAYAYEVSVIIQDGIRRMYQENEDIFYYVTIMNENYVHPPMPEGAREGILKGMHCVKPVDEPQAHLLGSGSILGETIAAAELLEQEFGVIADIWSVTSYRCLYDDGNSADRFNRLHPDDTPRTPYVTQCLPDQAIPTVAASDYVRAYGESIASWVPGSYTALGTDGFGRSAGRVDLRDFFEVDAKHIAYATLYSLAQAGSYDESKLSEALEKLGINTDRLDPVCR